MFVDESGDVFMKHFKNQNSKHLCLNGVIINLQDCEGIKTDINSLKTTFVNIDTDNANYPLRRREFIDCSPPFDTLKDKEVRVQYNARFLTFLRDWEFTTITVFIDKAKLHHRNTDNYSFRHNICRQILDENEKTLDIGVLA